ncbi:endonuclease III domain-containing protein [Candidatus Riesia pediculicola]|uniref:endonuclease III domain-containing protein n=1 Tax=Candidatus Riesia pediculicola TaxID=401619 RepID=UPI0009C32E23|nr:endonuclease III [Candidatus Riesia pediculicola]ARC54230.1 hypothetical protein AOE57_01290 [Candidatus Riesia pediculicola]
MNHKIRMEILNRFRRRDTYSSNTDLCVNSNFELLISTVLSTRSRNSLVNLVTEDLYRAANNANKMISLGSKKIKKIIEKIGLSRVKSKNILNICQILIQKYKGNVPNNRKSLEYLPGVGRKVSNVVLNIGFGYSTIAVDTHVFRVCNRTGFAISNSYLKLEKYLLSIVPIRFRRRFHYLFFLHGKVICTYKNPSCSCCFISDLCEYKNKNTTINS